MTMCLLHCMSPLLAQSGQIEPISAARSRKEGRMGRQAAVVLYVLALVAVVISLDVLFFKHRFWERLIVNVGIVLVFAAFYLRFLKHP
jgi:hypothetical protein